jgi:hypothetical protein
MAEKDQGKLHTEAEEEQKSVLQKHKMLQNVL